MEDSITKNGITHGSHSREVIDILLAIDKKHRQRRQFLFEADSNGNVCLFLGRHKLAYEYIKTRIGNTIETKNVDWLSQHTWTLR